VNRGWSLAVHGKKKRRNFLKTFRREFDANVCFTKLEEGRLGKKKKFGVTLAQTTSQRKNTNDRMETTVEGLRRGKDGHLQEDFRGWGGR